MAIAILITHMCLIPIGGNRFYRYDLYVFALTIMTLLYLYRVFLRNFFESHSQLALTCYALLLMIGVSFPFLGHALATPLASNNIFEQQYQMRKFSQLHYRLPVAVNDLGLVSYKSDQYVLDLWGLGSMEALTKRQNQSSGIWMDQLAHKHQVKLAMIYEQWFPDIPKNWIRLATLQLGKSKISPAQSSVSFYVVDEASIRFAEKALRSFQPTLPQGVRLDFEMKPIYSRLETHNSYN